MKKGTEEVINKESIEILKRETARPTAGKSLRLSNKLIVMCEETKERISKNFGAFVAKEKMRNIDIVNAFSPLISSESTVSRIMSGETKVPLSVLVALHYQYGVSLDEFIAGDTQRLNITPEFEDIILQMANKIIQLRNSKNPCEPGKYID